MSNFISNVLKLVSGSVASQVLSILLVPIITRIYSPDDMGIFQLFLSISGILVIFSTFSYQFAIMLPKSEEDSATISSLCAILVTVISLLTAVVVIFLPTDVEYILNAPGITNYLIYLPAITFFNGIFFVQNYWLSRKVRFGVIAGSRIVNTISTKAFQLAIPLWNNVSPFGLIVGFVAGYGFADLFMLRGVKEDINVFKKVSLKKIKELAIQYKRFPLFSSWSTLANTISPQVPAFLLAYFYSTSVVGYYSLANQVVNMPMGLLGAAIQQVFFQKISEVKNGNGEGDVKTIVEEVYKKLILIGVFPMILLLILGEQIFTFAFGESWSVSGTYIKILVPWLFLVFLSSPISSLYNIYEKQKVWLTFSMILLISRVVSLAIGGTYGGPEFALGLFSLTGVIFWLWNNAYLLNLAGIDKKESVEILIKYTSIGVVVSIPLILLEFLSANIYIIFLVAGIITPIYYIVTFREDPTFRKMFSTFLVNVKNKF
jgi:O-antigen/teichoic acid export membrane protein